MYAVSTVELVYGVLDFLTGIDAADPTIIL